MKKPMCLLLAGIFAFLFEAKAQNTNISGTEQKSPADVAWMNMPVIKGSGLSKNVDSNALTWQKLEISLRDFRSAGMKFWYNFPQDERRYQWLIKTLFITQPRYWLDIKSGAEKYARNELNWRSSKEEIIEADHKLINEWNYIFSKMKHEYLQDPTINDSLKRDFRLIEFSSHLESMAFFPWVHDYKKVQVEPISIMFDSCINRYNGKKGPFVDSPFETMIFAFEKYDKLGWSFDDIERFTKPYKSSKNRFVKEWVDQTFALLNLRRKPFVLKYPDINGQIIDLDKLKGKVVLLDLWSVSCGSCIARMYDIKPVYEKYKDKGFEVISINLDSEAILGQIHKIKEKVGASWPTLVTGGKTRQDFSTSFGTQIMKKFGWTTVPKLILLDKNGLMRGFQGVLLRGDLEPIIKELLAEVDENIH